MSAASFQVNFQSYLGTTTAFYIQFRTDLHYPPQYPTYSKNVTLIIHVLPLPTFGFIMYLHPIMCSPLQYVSIPTL